MLLFALFSLTFCSSAVAGKTEKLIEATADTYISPSFLTSPQGSRITLLVQRSGGGSFADMFLKFKISDIPEDKQITKATLEIYCFLDDFRGELKLWPLLGDWSESSLVVADGINIPTSNETRTSEEVVVGWVDTNITQLVKDWYDGSKANYGVRIGGDEGQDGSNAAFRSREFDSNPPRIRVTFADCTSDAHCGSCDVCEDNSCISVSCPTCQECDGDHGCQPGPDDCCTSDSACGLCERCESNFCVPVSCEGCDVCDNGHGCTSRACCQDSDCSALEKCSNHVCVSSCDDGSCNNGEDCSTCPTDCACPSGKMCVGGSCRPTGSCCEGASCSVTTQADCSGKWTNGDDCIGNPCEICCVNDADCNDADFCNGTETCLSCACWPGTPPCPSGECCDEDADSCVAGGTCSSNSECDNEDFCDGEERCVGGCCEAGTPPCGSQDCCEETDSCDACCECGDGICEANCDENASSCCEDCAECCDDDDCSDDSVCVGNNCVDCLDNSGCDDGLFCNGQELCVAGDCLFGDGPCGGVGGRLCDEENDDCCKECADDDDCANDDEFCKDGCCNGGPQPPACIPGDPDSCQDGLFCNGVEFCDDVTDECESPGSPCASSERCDEDQDCCQIWIPPTPCGACGEGAWVCALIGSFLWLGLRFVRPVRGGPASPMT